MCVCVCLSYHINEMPVVLIFGIATTINAVHHSLPHRVTSLLSMEKFQAPSSSDYLSMVLHQVSNKKFAVNFHFTIFTHGELCWSCMHTNIMSNPFGTWEFDLWLVLVCYLHPAHAVACGLSQ